jgi:hypothetical protein
MPPMNVLLLQRSVDNERLFVCGARRKRRGSCVWRLTVVTFPGVEHQHVIVNGRGIWVWAGAARFFDGAANSSDGAASAFSLAGLALGILMRAAVRESSHDGSVLTSRCCTHHHGLWCGVLVSVSTRLRREFAAFVAVRLRCHVCCGTPEELAVGWVAVLAAVELRCEVFWAVVQGSSALPLCIWGAYRGLTSRTAPNTYNNTAHNTAHNTQ